MASDVYIPGDELTELSSLLGGVLNLIDTDRGAVATPEVVGWPMTRAAANFDDKWGDGRYQLRKESKALKEAADQILQAFGDADNQAADSLSGKDPS